MDVEDPGSTGSRRWIQDLPPRFGHLTCSPGVTGARRSCPRRWRCCPD